MQQKGLHITIGAASGINLKRDKPEIDITGEVNMVKAALLYADRVKLCSMSASFFMSAISFEDLPIERKVEFLEDVLPYISQQPVSEAIAQALSLYKVARQKRYSKKGQAQLIKLKPAIEYLWEASKKTFTEVAHSIAGDTIIRAANSGLLEIHRFDISLSQAIKSVKNEDEFNGWFAEFVNVISASVADVRTYPLFDETVGDLMKAGMEHGVIPVSGSAVNRGRQARLAAEILERLPLFEEASVDEILDIRRELEKPLVRFRAAIIDYSEKVNSAAWDDDFPHDAEQVFNRNVAPEVLGIEDEVKANSYLRELARKWVDKPLLLTGGSALALAISNLPVPSLAALAVGITANTLAAIYDTNKEWRKQQQAAEGNSMFFYYRAGKMLSEKHE